MKLAEMDIPSIKSMTNINDNLKKYILGEAKL
jgi:hypothetical protein